MMKGKMICLSVCIYLSVYLSNKLNIIYEIKTERINNMLKVS